MAKLITDHPVERDALLCVTSEDCKPKGWRVELLVEKLSSKVEEKLLLCSCCGGLLRDACICNGALMCQVCIPEDIAWQPVEMNREIVNEKMIYCPLKCRGCGWNERVSAAVRHLEDCMYLPVACPLGCVSLEGERKGEVVKIERRHVAEHVRDSCPLRIIVCEFCEGEVKASEMNPHLEDCEEFPLPCPNGCSREGEEGMKELKRKDIPVHLDNHCPLQRVQCPYWDHGCREEMERRHTDTHEREFLHIHFNHSMTEITQNQNTSNLRLQHALDTANEKITVVSNELSEVREELSEKIEILERELTDKDQRITLLSDMLSSYFQSQLPTGRLEWHVKGVKQKIPRKDITYGDPFYVGLYKCQSSIEWKCSNTSKVGVFIHIMKGDFDAKLLWPIRYKFTFVLTNQINSEDNLVYSTEVNKKYLEEHPECFKRPTEYRNRSFGNTSFISNTDIIQEKYCKQDYITLHISVEVLPPL